MKWRLFLMGVLLLTGCLEELPEGNTRIVLEGPTGESISLQVERADTQESRARGLMGRTEVPEGTGMLFLFEHEQPLSFWMKNTLVPLDILFFDASGDFVSLATMTPCHPEPVEGCQGYPSAGPAAFALEVRAGFAQEHGVGKGWGVSFE